jgi:outer membrane protein W
MKLRTIGMTVVAALALVAGRAQAQDVAAPAPAAAPAAGEDAGWNTKAGVLFTLPNPFGGGSGTNVLNDYDGKVGVQLNLAPQAALRLSAKLARRSEGVLEVTTAAGTTETVPGFTSGYTANLMAQYMIRMTTAAVSPYMGFGAFVTFNQDSKNGEDKTNGTVDMKYDDYFRDSSLGANATLGLEWRVHKAIALFAEYQADLTLASFRHDKTRHTSSVGTSETETKEKHFGNLGMDIAQGGQLGVIGFF